jgi:tetratricopeptide (TPR) repeat protein
MKIYDHVILRVARPIVITILIASFAYSVLNIQLWDYDFWWHIATGRYIVTEGHIPEKDPFSFTTILPENKNKFPVWEDLILKQYWLSQVIFYLIYDYAGAKGIIILRTILLITTLIIVFWKLKKYSVSFPLKFLFLFILSLSLGRYTGERPVLFTILFTALTFFILDNFRDEKDKKILLLIPLMLLWANMHGGFIIGIIIILVFMLGEGIKIILKRGDYTKNKVYLFYIVAILAIGISYFNPAGWDAFDVAMQITTKYKPFHLNIQEYASPFSLFYKYKVYPFQYEYLAMIILFLLVLILRNKKIDLTHMILLSGTFIASVSAIRFIVYYMIIGTMVIGEESDILIGGLLKRRFSESTYTRIMDGLTIPILLSIILYSAGIYKSDIFRFDIAKDYLPEAAVNFIEKNKLSGNMFNDYAYGGYITWRLYPRQKTFIDTRSLNMTVRIEYTWITQATEYAKEVNPSKSNTPLWKRLLNHYKINFIFLPMLDPYTQINPIIFKLIDSNEWVPVYCDPMSVIFVRNNEQNKCLIKRFKISEDDIYNAIIFQASLKAIGNQVNPRSLMSLGEVFYKMGRLEDALKAYRYAFDRMPGNTMILEKIKQLESEIKGKRLLLDHKEVGQKNKK